MLKLRDGIVELYKKVATSLPPDVENALKGVLPLEPEGSRGRETLRIIIENVREAREKKRPLCQDTGVPMFWIKVPFGLSHREIEEIIIEATKVATEKIPLRANAVDVISEKNSGNNTGHGFPVIYFEETGASSLVIDLMLKGAGCENAGQLYKLPDPDLNAERNLDGVRKAIIDTAYRAQGRGCPPYTFGVGIGATKDQVSLLSKKQLFRKLDDRNTVQELSDLEQRLAVDINQLEIGPIGLGGNTTLLGAKIGICHRHPASYFVDVSVSCWANRRGRLIWS